MQNAVQSASQPLTGSKRRASNKATEKPSKVQKLDDSDDEVDDDDEPPLQGEELVEYNRKLRKIVEQTMIGKFYFPIMAVTPPRSESLVRELKPNFVTELAARIKKVQSGQYFRNPLQINIYPYENNTQEEKVKENWFLNQLKEIQKLNGQNTKSLNVETSTEISGRFYKILDDPEFGKLFKFEAIGGNHTREACQRLLLEEGNSEKIGKSIAGTSLKNCMEANVFLNLSIFSLLLLINFF